MFLKNSRYAAVPTVSVPDPHGTGEVAMVKLRPLPVVTGEPTEVRAHEQLDAMSESRWGDPTRYWHIADANSELEAAELTRVPGRIIQAPRE